MARYVTRAPRSWIEEDVFAESHRPELVVSVSEAIDTGLLDADGHPLFRLPNPIGFGRDGEW